MHKPCATLDPSQASWANYPATADRDLVAGLAIRLALAYVLLPVSGFYFDVPAFASWALSHLIWAGYPTTRRRGSRTTHQAFC